MTERGSRERASRELSIDGSVEGFGVGTYCVGGTRDLERVVFSSGVQFYCVGEAEEVPPIGRGVGLKDVWVLVVSLSCMPALLRVHVVGSSWSFRFTRTFSLDV